MTSRAPNLIDKLAGLVPGYTSFSAKEARRDADKRLRDHVAAVLDGAKRHVDEVVLELTKAGRLDGLDDADRLKRRLGAVADSVRYAEHGETGFMDERVFEEEDLERIYDHDLRLLEQAGQVVTTVSELHAEGFDEGLKACLAAVGEFNESVRQRESLLREVF
jgi:hypothetical protein